MQGCGGGDVMQEERKEKKWEMGHLDVDALLRSIVQSFNRSIDFRCNSCALVEQCREIDVDCT